jgi:signal transduction histidine kinase
MKAHEKIPRSSPRLATTLTRAFLTVSVAALVISGGLQIFTNVQAQQAIIASQQQFIAQDAAKAVSSFFQEKFSLLETVGQLARPNTAALDEHKQLLGSLLGRQPAFRQLVLLNAQDQPVAQVSRVARTVSGQPSERFGSELLAQVKQGKNYISPVYIDPITSEPLVVMASPSTNAFGGFQGTLVAEVNLKFMWDLIDQLKVGETGTAYVVDKQGNLIAFSDIARVLRGDNVRGLDEVSRFINTSSSAAVIPARLATGIEEGPVVTTYVPLGTPDWAVVTEMSVAEAYREVIRGVATAIGITLVIAVLAGLLGLYVARRLATPLIHLTETATAIAQGERSLQAVVQGPIEITSLADAFNSMTAQLQQSLEDLEQRIVEIKRAEDERERLIADLETKNAELERFTYTVSHDLKAPLITIRGFLGFLEKDVRAGEAERAQTDMQRIMGATDKMQRLLSELLELSRVGRMMNAPEAVRFETIAQEAVSLIQGRLEGRGICVVIAPDLPTVYGDRARLVEVMQNLVDNAAKFVGDQAEPQIAIGQQGVDRDGKPILFVRDNGLGIDPAYHGKVFGLFNKLDPLSEGTGVGLALVKRIVEVHGGRIWLESAGAGHGTTFFFTLPGSPEQAGADLKGHRE